MESINIIHSRQDPLIVDLNLRGNLVIIVGGGNEGLKKVNSLLTQECKILLISDSTNRQIQNYVKQKKYLSRK
jgi:precorrin-2 dehydrogenase/sirohydrochlorin ferrochelatase